MWKGRMASLPVPECDPLERGLPEADTTVGAATRKRLIAVAAADVARNLRRVGNNELLDEFIRFSSEKTVVGYGR